MSKNEIIEVKNTEILKNNLKHFKSSDLWNNQINFELEQIKKRLINLTDNQNIKDLNPQKSYELAKLWKFKEILWIDNFLLNKITDKEIEEISKLKFSEFENYFNNLHLYFRK